MNGLKRMDFLNEKMQKNTENNIFYLINVIFENLFFFYNENVYHDLYEFK